MYTPLVSICIITYNSSKYILETLDSAKRQTYKNLELIISDDCSTDNTIDLCQNWIKENKERFVRVEILTVENNTGIAANCNRANAACRGEWIKALAGDDMFLPECIKDNVSFINEHPDAKIVFSQMIHFINNFNFRSDDYTIRQKTQLKKFFKLSCEEQLFVISHRCILPAPTLFSKKGFIEDTMGGYATKYYFEDWPMWIDILEKQIPIYYLEKETIAYRRHGDSTSIHLKTLFNINMEKARIKLIRDKCEKYYSKRKIISEILMYKFRLLINFCNLNHNNVFCKLIYVPVVKLFNLISDSQYDYR